VYCSTHLTSWVTLPIATQFHLIQVTTDETNRVLLRLLWLPRSVIKLINRVPTPVTPAADLSGTATKPLYSVNLFAVVPARLQLFCSFCGPQRRFKITRVELIFVVLVVSVSMAGRAAKSSSTTAWNLNITADRVDYDRHHLHHSGRLLNQIDNLSLRLRSTKSVLSNTKSAQASWSSNSSCTAFHVLDSGLLCR